MRLGVIMSGGRGRRFWPLSRSVRAKQLVPIVGNRTLLGLTVERVLPLFGAGNIIVVTHKLQAGLTRQVLEPFGRIRILAEPEGKNTAACIAYAAAWIEATVGDAVVACLPADHFIKDTGTFRKLVEAGMDFAEDSGMLLTIGISPAGPATGFGYIRKGEEIARHDGFAFCRVSAFTEKPSLEKARAYVEAGDYLWNAGIFVFKVSVILEEIRKHLPGLAGRIERCRQRFGKADEEACLAEAYADIEDISIDVGVMERTQHAAVVPADIGWDDVGSWVSFSKYMTQDEKGNSVHGPHVGLDTEGCVIYSDGKVIATIGLRDVAIVATEDAVLVMARDRGEGVKAMVDLLEAKGLTHLL